MREFDRMYDPKFLERLKGNLELWSIVAYPVEDAPFLSPEEKRREAVTQRWRDRRVKRVEKCMAIYDVSVADLEDDY